MLKEKLLENERYQWDIMEENPPDHDPNCEDEPLTGPEDAMGKIPRLAGLLWDTRERTGLHLYEFAGSCNFVKDSANDLEKILDDGTQDELGKLALAALREQREKEEDRRPRE